MAKLNADTAFVSECNTPPNITMRLRLGGTDCTGLPGTEPGHTLRYLHTGLSLPTVVISLHTPTEGISGPSRRSLLLQHEPPYYVIQLEFEVRKRNSLGTKIRRNKTMATGAYHASAARAGFYSLVLTSSAT